MSDYFRHAQIVSRSLDWAGQTAPTARRRQSRPVADGIRFVDTQRAAREPRHLVHGVSSRASTTTPRSATKRWRCIQQHVDGPQPKRLLSDLRRAARPAQVPETAARSVRPAVGNARPRPARPDVSEFQAIYCRVVRDFYHGYTVDGPTLLTIRNLERLVPPRRRAGTGLRGSSPICRNPNCSCFALIFHDTGKSRDEDHHLESVRLARGMFERLSLPLGVACDGRVSHREVLRMSLVAFRATRREPEIVRQFAELVGIEERLKMLCLMTLVDVEAVSTETLTPWREELLWRLYVDTYNHLTLAYGDERIDRDEEGVPSCVPARPDEVSEPEIRRFLLGLPCRYLSLFDGNVIYQHIRLSHDIKPDHVDARSNAKATRRKSPWLRSTSPFSFPISAACCRRSAWTSCVGTR